MVSSKNPKSFSYGSVKNSKALEELLEVVSRCPNCKVYFDGETGESIEFGNRIKQPTLYRHQFCCKDCRETYESGCRSWKAYFSQW